MTEEEEERRKRERETKEAIKGVAAVNHPSEPALVHPLDQFNARPVSK